MAGFLQSRISKGYRPTAAGRRGPAAKERQWPWHYISVRGIAGAVVWASGDVDTNVAETFQDMMLSVMRREDPSLLLDLSGVSFMDGAE